MAKKTFKGRPLLSGNLKGKALASKQPLNTTGSYLENLFGEVGLDVASMRCAFMSKVMTVRKSA